MVVKVKLLDFGSDLDFFFVVADLAVDLVVVMVVVCVCVGLKKMKMEK